MKSLFSKLLPFFFLAMLSLAPLHAQAQSTPGNGSFDCLGNLDWGCRVIGFLFQPTDNDLIYYKDGVATAPEAQTPAIKALRAMMEFFSNALLIIASIKLLYELIQMTAETAQTGQVGGKDANKLWAPIRLVFAIGLLVPIASGGGLNSGQFIVLQVAKWGSGMASQGWKVFTAKLGDGDSLTVPPPPRIKDLAYTTVKIYACKAMINYYASKLGLTDDIVNGDSVPDNTSARYIFRNKISKDICGIIRYNVPTVAFANTDLAAQTSLNYAKANRDDFINAEGQIASAVGNLILPFTPTGRTLPKPKTDMLDGIINNFQQQVTDRVTKSNKDAKALMKDLTDKIQAAANTQGWTSAGSYFLDITKAESQLINGALNIPQAIGPNLEVMKTYPSAYASYQELMAHLDNGARPQDTGTTAADRATMTATSENQSFLDFLKTFGTNIVSDPAEELFRFIDKAAVAVGLWESDPRKAFGDLGASNNPFGEIAALGHKKIRLALNYVSYAILAAGGGALVSGIGGIASNVPILGGVLKGGGAMISGLSPILMVIATLFFLAGVLLAYIVPMLPFTRFFFSILTWLGSLVEAMILVPFMSLAFLTPKGEGFTGPNTRNAIFFIFQLFVRPILCVFGLICAMVTFYVAAKFLNASFYGATSGVYDYVNEGSAMRFMQKLVYSVMYVGLIYTAANVSFKMIEHIPRAAMNWLGGSAKEESYDEHDKFLGLAAAVGGPQLLNQLQALPQNLIAPIKQGAAAFASSQSKPQVPSANNQRQLLGQANGRDGGSNGSNQGGDDGAPNDSGPNDGGQSPGGAGARRALTADATTEPRGAASGGNDVAAPQDHDSVTGGNADGPQITNTADQRFNDQIAANAGRDMPAAAIPASRLAQLSAPAKVNTILNRVRASVGGFSTKQETAVRAAVTSHLAGNANDEEGAISAGIQARNDPRNA